MTTEKKDTDVIIFFGGVILGILGNLFVEYYNAYVYPQGITQDAAGLGVLVMVVLMTVYMIIIVFAIRSKPVRLISQNRMTIEFFPRARKLEYYCRSARTISENN